jgi:hypothetical protein
VFFIVLLFPAISTGWRLPHFNPLIDAAKLRKIFHSCKYLKKKPLKFMMFSGHRAIVRRHFTPRGGASRLHTYAATVGAAAPLPFKGKGYG